jgi:ubiquinone biosynthesis protein UbiJ
MSLPLPFTAALNHVLRQQAWARARLAPFAGETVELRAAPWPALRWTIRPDGEVADAAPGAEPALVVALRAEAPAAFLRGEEHFLRAIDVSGNARLADEVMALARNLRWDFEEDLSRLVGDVAAHRVGEAARAFVGWQRDAARRLGEALADYAGDEAKLVASRRELEALARGTAELRDALERLEQRARRLG